MKKMSKTKIIVLLLTFFAIIFGAYVISYGYEIPYIKDGEQHSFHAESAGDVTKFASEHPDAYLAADLTKYLGKDFQGPYVTDTQGKKDAKTTVLYNTGSCGYHNQGHYGGNNDEGYIEHNNDNNNMTLAAYIDVEFTTNDLSGVKLSVNGKDVPITSWDQTRLAAWSYSVKSCLDSDPSYDAGNWPSNTGNMSTDSKKAFRHIYYDDGIRDMLRVRGLLPKEFDTATSTEHRSHDEDETYFSWADANHVSDTGYSAAGQQAVIKKGMKTRICLWADKAGGSQNQFSFAYGEPSDHTVTRTWYTAEYGYDNPPEDKPNSLDVSVNRNNIGTKDETPDALYASIRKVDDRDTGKPLPHISFKFSAKVKVYEKYASDQQWHTNNVWETDYSSPQKDKDGNIIKDANGNTLYNDHLVDRGWWWTRNHYHWVEHTAYLTESGWTINSSGSSFETDQNGIINLGGTLTDYTKTENDETEGNNRVKYARFTSNIVTATEETVAETTAREDGFIYGYKENEGRVYSLNGNITKGSDEDDLSGYKFKFSAQVQVYESIDGVSYPVHRQRQMTGVTRHDQRYSDSSYTLKVGDEEHTYIVLTKYEREIGAVIDSDGKPTDIRRDKIEYDDYTAHAYHWVTHTAWLTKSGKWVISDDGEAGDVFETDANGNLSANGTLDKYNVIIDDYADMYKNYKPGTPYRKYAKFVGGYSTKSLGKGGSEGGSDSGSGSGSGGAKYPSPTVEAQHQKRVMVSGYVWLDQAKGKLSTTNGLYDGGDDKGINGIQVSLRYNGSNALVYSINPDGTQGAPCITTTSEQGLYDIDGGEYRFENVNLDEIGSYHAEFEYCGVQYQSVKPNYSAENGSKAKDDADRENLDKQFSSVVGNGTESLTVGNVGLNYEGVSDYKSTMKEHIDNYNTSPLQYNQNIPAHTGCDVTATTDGYALDTTFKPRDKEIKNINCGLFRKAQTDYALTTDLDNVRIEVNGRAHVYNYGTNNHNGEIGDEGQAKKVDTDNPYKDDPITGVKFQNYMTGGYNRPVYQSDADYAVTSGTYSSGLQIYMTYKVSLRNESVYDGRINTIAEYHGSNVRITGASTGLDENKTIKGGTALGCGGSTNVDIIELGNAGQVGSGDKAEIYLEYQVTDEAVLQLQTGQDVLVNNVGEIHSYTTFDDGKAIAVYDKDSVPFNVKYNPQPVSGAIDPDISTFEDDTDAAPKLMLAPVEPRTISGTVFVDNTGKDEKTTYTGQERKGNGLFDDGTTLKDIQVSLICDDGPSAGSLAKTYGFNKTDAIVKTDGSGNYQFRGYIPGKYHIEFTWGDKTYRVQYYKSTIYKGSGQLSTESNYDKSKGNGTTTPASGVSGIGAYTDDPDFWYRVDAGTRANDAVDFWNLRQEVDGQMTEYSKVQNESNQLEDVINQSYDGGNTGYDTKMTSFTPSMEISVEHETTLGTQSDGQFNIQNVDFGIVQRPLQQMDITKRIAKYRLVLANGQVLVDAEVTGEKNNPYKLSVTGTQEHTVFPQLGSDNWGGSSKDGSMNKADGSARTIGLIRTEMDNELIDGATIEITHEIVVTNTSEIDYTGRGYYWYGNPDGSVVSIMASKVLDYMDKKYQIQAVNNDPTNNISPVAWNEQNKDILTTYNASEKDADPDELNNIRIYLTEGLKGIKLTPNAQSTMYFQTSKRLAASDNNEFNNKTEIIGLQKDKPNGPTDGNTGTPVRTRFDENHPKTFDTSTSERITILPSTGGNKDYKTPIAIAILFISIFGIGIVLIKKYVDDNKK